MKVGSSAQWSHPSVRLLAGTRDPIEAIIERARAVVVAALDAGWSGPPYDPMALADHLGLHVRPLADVPDARLLKEPSGKAVIEFNPNRPPARVRYSIAHEIGHSLFPDCFEATRGRLARHELEQPEDWQVELLCNLAAAEFLMPVGSFPKLSGEALDIGRLMELRVEFQVSSEALLLRIARLSSEPTLMFSAARIESGPHAGRYRLEYAIAEKGFPPFASKGLLLPESTVVADCKAIGYTAKADEEWVRGHPIHVELVGVPPYPGARHPRVVGLGRAAAGLPPDTRITEVRGSALEPRGQGPRILVHIANDRARNWGGGGFASRVGQKWPAVHRDFREWIEGSPSSRRLGGVRFCKAEKDLIVATMVAQHGYGPSSAPRVRYAALDKCLKEVARQAASLKATVHMPRVGTGLAGGSWWIIRELIENNIANRGLNVTVYQPPTGSDPLPRASRSEDRAS